MPNSSWTSLIGITNGIPRDILRSSPQVHRAPSSVDQRQLANGISRHPSPLSKKRSRSSDTSHQKFGGSRPLNMVSYRSKRWWKASRSLMLTIAILWTAVSKSTRGFMVENTSASFNRFGATEKRAQAFWRGRSTNDRWVAPTEVLQRS